MTPGARRIARSLAVIQRKAERLRERDDLPKRAETSRDRARDCCKKLQWAHQRCCTTGWNDPDHQASLNELRVASRAYRQALYELLAVAWLAEVPLNSVWAQLVDLEGIAFDQLCPVAEGELADD